MAEFDKNNGGNTQDRARNAFLWVLADDFPQVTQQLAQKPLSEYQKLLAINPQHTNTEKYSYLAGLSCERFEREKVDRLEPTDPFISLHAALHEWSTAFNLEAEWVMCHALDLLAQWAHDTLSEKYLGGYGNPLPSFDGEQKMPDGSSFDFEFKIRWRFDRERKSDFLKRAKAALDQYLRNMEKYATDAENGYTRNTEQRKLEEHLRWLAKYQVGNLTYAQIADQLSEENPDGIDISSIEKGVEKTAKLIKLPLRTPSSRGRKPKNLN